MHKEIGALIAEARGAAGMTQQQVADRLAVHQSRVSRIEAGEGAKDDYQRYLAAVGSDHALSLADKLKVEWRFLPQPSFRHPDFDVLLHIENALDRLDTFRQSETIPAVLNGQANLLFGRLSEFGEFLLSLDHEIVYVGKIGVGKTTAACRQAGLETDPSTAADLKGMILDTGGGRTTLCDVRVERGDRFALSVKPLPDEEVYRLATESCRAVWEKMRGEVSAITADFKPAEEVERALRNMADLPRPSRPKKGGIVPPDPAAALAETTTSFEDFKAEVASRLRLWRRTRRRIEYDGADEAMGRQWLRTTFAAINNGRHSDFSLPGRIIVTVPFALVSDTQFGINVVDTRGVDGSAIRTDILEHLKNKRAVTLLCSEWGSAPDPASQDLLRHLAETEVDPKLNSRVAILALARAGDALSMRHDSGEGAEDISEGYEIKRGHIEDALHRIGMVGIDIYIFDAASDDPVDLSIFIQTKIKGFRATQADAAQKTISAVNQMLENVEQAQALAAVATINNDLKIFSGRHERLSSARRGAHQRLLRAVRSSHPRTIWATTRRAGTFWNFNVFQHLGDGAAAEAKVACRPALDGLREIIRNRLEDNALETAHGFLRELLAKVDTWEADFVKAARHHAITLYRAPLAGSAELWDSCEEQYGSGTGYRDDVTARLERWFDNNRTLEDELGSRVDRAWQTTVLEPLGQAAGGS